MSHRAASTLERHASEIRDRLLAVADKRIDPAVWLDQGGGFFVAEHLLLMAAIARHHGAEELQLAPGSIVVAVVDGNGAALEKVPDPRVYPDRWPWSAPGDDAENSHPQP